MTDQLSLLLDLDRASDTNRPNLCTSWKNARANECDVQDVTAGRGSPVMQKYSPNFDVHECAPNVMLMVEHFVRDVCRGYKVTEKLITDALDKMEKSIKEMA